MFVTQSNSASLVKFVYTLLAIILSVVILKFSASVLAPLTFGLVLAMLLVPICNWFEKRGLNRGVSSAVCVLLLLIVVAGLFFILQWQIGDMVKNLSKIEKQLQGVLDKVMSFVQQKVGLSESEQEQMIQKQKSGGVSKIAGLAVATFTSFTSFLVSTILALIYTFLFIYFRRHFKNFVVKLAPEEKKQHAEKTVAEVSKITQEYISGLGLMIVSLWIMYGIGFSIVGVENAIFFAILCGTLEIIPFAGNITGTSVTVLTVIAQGGGTGMVIGVLVTYGLVQFIQSYILQPLVVGKQVDIHPLFTILIIVIGEAIWGIPGMVLALPLLGMFKVICDNVEGLKPYGYLIGGSDEDKPAKKS